MAHIEAEMKARYRADPSIVGWVTAVEGDNARVFINGSTKLVPLAELEPVPGLTEMGPRELRNYLTWRRLEHSLTEQLFSYKASRTDLYYHQFLPVKKILESPDQRLLIADEVGTGKTIEAGLIWAELESRSKNGLENVWVICPKSLMGKWRDEMQRRFDLRLEPMSSDNLRQALVSLERDGVLSPRFAKTIVNLELIRAEVHLTRLIESSISWDLVIFDEAHHLRNPDTLSHHLAEFVCQHSKVALFLSATPLQTSLLDIVHLMNAMGVEIAAEPDLLEEQLHWDMLLNDWIRLVRRQPPGWKLDASRLLNGLETGGGRNRPGWNGFRRLAAGSDLADRRQRTMVIDSARDLQVLSPHMTRTYRSDVDENRPTREAITNVVQFTPEEEAFYQQIYEVCLERARREGNPPGFVTQMPERRTASCVPAVAFEILQYEAEDEQDEHSARFTPSEINALAPLARAALRSEDQKLAALHELLAHVFGELRADRAIIFSTFRGTLRYLAKQLQASGYSLELMYGLTPARDEDCRRGEKSRERIAAEFRRGDFQILLASEVAGEGLDFEHCHVVVNYDLPWNPMRVEQRIGRCDRLGQASDKIYVGNLASVGTIESRIVDRLYTRLGIFERALGDMEVILGESITKFRRDVFKRNLTPGQQELHLDRTAQVMENQRLQRESISKSGVISKQGRLLIESDQQEIKEAETRFLSPEDLAEFVYSSIERRLPGCMRRTAAPSEFEVLRSDDLNSALHEMLRAYPATHYARTEVTRFRNRTGQSRSTTVSFVKGAEGVDFAHIRHPLVLLARRLAGNPISDTPWCRGLAPPESTDRTKMLVWAVGSLEGYTERVELLCAAVDCATGKVNSVPVEQAQDLMKALSAPEAGNTMKPYIDVESLKTQAERTLLSQFKSITDTFAARESILIEKARQAVISHNERQVIRNQRQLVKEDLNPKLRAMYTGWNRRIEEETHAKLADIEQKSGIRSSLEIIGMAVIHPEAAPSTPDERVQPRQGIIPASDSWVERVDEHMEGFGER